MENFIRNFVFKYIYFGLIDKINRLIKVKKFIYLSFIKLNLGCGEQLKESYINIDLYTNSDLRIDLRRGIPFRNNSVELIL